MDTIREQIIQSLVEIIENHTGGQYGTVYRGRTYFTPTELPAVSVLPGVESSERQYGEQFNTMPMVVHVAQVIGDYNSSVLAEVILGDMIESTIGQRSQVSKINDLRYTGGGAEDYPDADEQTQIVVLNLEIEYTTNIGDPYNQTEL